MISGKWPRGHLVGREIGGRILGLVGLDYGACAAARRGQALGIVVVGWDPLLKETHAAWAGIERMASTR